MSVRRLWHEQPDSFAFSDENAAWAEKAIKRYPEGRQASAVIPLLWKAQEQEGWVSEPAIRFVADMLSMPYIRVLEVATFYTMFQLQPVGKKAHVQVCGTTPCMLRGAGDLIAICKRRIAENPHDLSADGDFSWEEVECLGACVNAPMIQVVKDTYEDLTAESFETILDQFAAGETPEPGPQNGRHHSAPLGGPVVLKDIDGLAPAGDTDVAVAERPETATQSDENKPVGLDAPRDGKADDLQKISGVGPEIEGLLNALGIYHYDQVAAWTADEVAWVDGHLKFRGRIGREDWIAQAKILADGGETEFSKRTGKEG